MNKITVSAKNLDLALIKAAGELTVARDDVCHEIKEESSGFCGFGKKVIIVAWSKHAKSSGGYKTQKPRKRSRVKTAVVDEAMWGALAEELQGFLKTMISYSFGIDAKISVQRDIILQEERMVLNIDSSLMSNMFEENLRLAESFEHILRKKPRHIKRELPFKIFIDACSMRVNREQELTKLAKSVSDKVHTTHKSMTLDYESSYDRKVIHMALDKDKRVYTRSVGRGMKRRLIIAPSRS